MAQAPPAPMTSYDVKVWGVRVPEDHDPKEIMDIVQNSLRREGYLFSSSEITERR